MITILVDHNIEGQAMMLWRTLEREGWPELFPLRFVIFTDVGLPYESSDRQVWQFAQKNRMILLTGNRRMGEEDSLEQTLREENTLTSLPVLTIGKIDRMVERTYRERCEAQLLNVLLNLDNYLGTARIFIP
jgi:hypothetical protein